MTPTFWGRFSISLFLSCLVLCLTGYLLIIDVTISKSYRHGDEVTSQPPEVTSLSSDLDLMEGDLFVRLFGSVTSGNGSGSFMRMSDMDWRLTAPRLTREDRKFWKYLEQYEILCEAGYTQGAPPVSGSAFCPCVSPYLHGRQPPNETELHNLTWPEVDTIVPPTLIGGFWRPTGCAPRLRLAVIIPYRDREEHLRAQLATLHGILQRQLAEYTVYVVEQTWPALFNKGAMMDIGFIEATKRGGFDCVLFQDVDLIMEDDRNIVHCYREAAVHLGVYLDKNNYQKKYEGLIGGALSFSPWLFRKVGGYTTLFFGWGGEDDNMMLRLRRWYKVHENYTAVARAPKVARYTHIKTQADKANPKDSYRRQVVTSIRERGEDINGDDLEKVRYRLKDVVKHQLFTLVNVQLDVREMPTYRPRNVSIYTWDPAGCHSNHSRVHRVSIATCKYICDETLTCRGFFYTAHTGSDAHCLVIKECYHGNVTDAGRFYKKRGRTLEVKEWGRTFPFADLPPYR